MTTAHTSYWTDSTFASFLLAELFASTQKGDASLSSEDTCSSLILSPFILSRPSRFGLFLILCSLPYLDETPFRRHSHTPTPCFSFSVERGSYSDAEEGLQGSKGRCRCAAPSQSGS